MNDMALVGSNEGLGDLKCIGSGMAQGKSALIQPVAQSLAFEQLGDDIRGCALKPDVENGKDIGMV